MSDFDQPITDHHAAIYGDYFDSVYSEANALSSGTFRAQLRQARHCFGPFLPAERDTPMIDCGCGAGFLVWSLREMGYRNAFGVDASESMVNACRANSIPVVHANALEHLRDNPATYGAILANDFVEHLDKTTSLEFLRLAARALKPGGRVLIAVPNALSPFGASYLYRDPTHEQLFTVETIRTMFAVTGLKEVSIAGARILPQTAPGKVLRGVRQVYRLWWRGFMVAEMGHREGLRAPMDIRLLAVGTPR